MSCVICSTIDPKHIFHDIDIHWIKKLLNIVKSIWLYLCTSVGLCKAFAASRYFFITLAAYYISRHNIYHWHGQQTIVWLNLIQQVYSSWYQYKSISNEIEEKTKSFKTFHSVFSSSNTYKNNQKRCRGYSINNNNTHNWYLYMKKKRIDLFLSFLILNSEL